MFSAWISAFSSAFSVRSLMICSCSSATFSAQLFDDVGLAPRALGGRPFLDHFAEGELGEERHQQTTDTSGADHLHPFRDAARRCYFIHLVFFRKNQ